MKKGFTLVELSIVLVIIGLLIGGILVARSMIETSKLTRLERDLQQYYIAFNTFKTTYKYWPGDYGGNQDGVIGLTYNPNCCGNGGEDGKAWQELVTMLNVNPAPPTPTDTGCDDLNVIPGCNPIFSYFPTTNGNPGLMVMDSSLLTAQPYEYYYGGSVAGTNMILIGTNFLTGFLTPMEALAIDQKIDDGNPVSGKIITMPPNNDGSNGCVNANANWGTWNNPTWNLSVQTSNCRMGVWLLPDTVL